jgi:superfamily I DNA/RNA helicase
MNSQNSSSQQEALHTIYPGPVLILAGPGTGKTHSLALRIKWLVEEQSVSPDEITVITFTAEAALNLRRRLSDEEKPDVFMPRDKQPSQIFNDA